MLCLFRDYPQEYVFKKNKKTRLFALNNASAEIRALTLGALERSRGWRLGGFDSARGHLRGWRLGHAYAAAQTPMSQLVRSVVP